jgi:hypothetical protein
MLSSLEALTQRFNAYQNGKLFMVLNEIQSYGGSFRDADKLKTIITERDRLVEPKGKEAYSIKCYENYILISNNDWTVRVDADDRRYPCTRVSDKYRGNKPYFDRLVAVLTAGYAAKFMGLMMARNITEWNPRAIPTTELRTEMKLMSLSPPIRFLMDVVKKTPGIHLNLKEDDEEVRLAAPTFYGEFTDWCARNRQVYSQKADAFWAEMKKIDIKVKAVRFPDAIQKGVLFDIGELQGSLRTYLRDPSLQFE